MLLHAVSDTDNATSPLAIMEKMLDELPPGEQAMSMMPHKQLLLPVVRLYSTMTLLQYLPLSTHW